jgi:membrane protease YdiL (CAAX protease family)
MVVLLPVSLRAVEELYHWLWDLSYTAQVHPLIRELSEEATASDFWLVAMLAGAIAPLTEEIFFRGFLQGALAQLFRSRWVAIIGTAAIFSVFHMTLENIPALFFLGVVLGYAYEKSGSLYRPMAIHLVFNALSILTAFWKAT